MAVYAADNLCGVVGVHLQHDCNVCHGVQGFGIVPYVFPAWLFYFLFVVCVFPWHEDFGRECVRPFLPDSRDVHGEKRQIRFKEQDRFAASGFDDALDARAGRDADFVYDAMRASFSASRQDIARGGDIRRFLVCRGAVQEEKVLARLQGAACAVVDLGRAGSFGIFHIVHGANVSWRCGAAWHSVSNRSYDADSFVHVLYVDFPEGETVAMADGGHGMHPCWNLRRKVLRHVNVENAMACIILRRFSNQGER